MVVTLCTAGICGLLYLWLSIRVVQVRFKSQVSLGDGGDPLLLQRIRAHANFAEYVPICLVLIAAIELAHDTAPLALWVAGAALVLARVCHIAGLSRSAPNGWRVAGAGGTWTVMGLLSLWALVLALAPAAGA